METEETNKSAETQKILTVNMTRNASTVINMIWD